jgi:hyperosmotically inducible protein
MKLDRISYAVVATALAVGAAGCASYTGSGDPTAKKQLAAAGEAKPRGPVETISDAAINTKVKAVLAADGMVKARNINVDTLKGVVQLNGTVMSSAEKNQALALTRQVDGVVEVVDNLRIVG